MAVFRKHLMASREEAATVGALPKGAYTSGSPEVIAIEKKRGYESTYEMGPPEAFYEATVKYYEGRVLSTHARVERIMSDVWDTVTYAFVENDEGDLDEVAICASEFGGAWATIDATEECKARIAEWKNLMAEFNAVRAKVRAERAAAKAAAKEAATPRKGKTVKVVKGRKVPKGTVGTVVWYGEGKKYSYYGSAPMRVGLKDASGTVHWTAASNVEVVTESEGKAA